MPNVKLFHAPPLQGDPVLPIRLQNRELFRPQHKPLVLKLNLIPKQQLPHHLRHKVHSHIPPNTLPTPMPESQKARLHRREVRLLAPGPPKRIPRVGVGIHGCVAADGCGGYADRDTAWDVYAADFGALGRRVAGHGVPNWGVETEAFDGGVFEEGKFVEGCEGEGIGAGAVVWKERFQGLDEASFDGGVFAEIVDHPVHGYGASARAGDPNLCYQLGLVL